MNGTALIVGYYPRPLLAFSQTLFNPTEHHCGCTVSVKADSVIRVEETRSLRVKVNPKASTIRAYLAHLCHLSSVGDSRSRTEGLRRAAAGWTARAKCLRLLRKGGAGDRIRTCTLQRPTRWITGSYDDETAPILACILRAARPDPCGHMPPTACRPVAQHHV